MILPYQRLVARTSVQNGVHEWMLIGASGSTLVVQSSLGTSSAWTSDGQLAHTNDGKGDAQVQEPPGKRVKLSPPSEHKANFSSLVLSSDEKHLVAVTAEDKCIRVFEIGEDCHLHQLSQRCMLRRPCSITLIQDDSTILCADKFGDVYALPLFPLPEDEPSEAPSNDHIDKKFTPSASLLTVHSGRNRKTLEEQIKQASKGPARTREPLKFKHELLLGHVSMLTDIIYASVGRRGYILTADRDEHIRVSRGPPHAHIIEGFCQGHEEFVNRLCLTKAGRLVSGGGDAYLSVWDWLNFRLVTKLDIRTAVLSHSTADEQHKSLYEDDVKVAVTGIWSVPCSNSEMDEILVACEGVAALFSFKINEPSTCASAVPLKGNPLDVAFINLSESSSTAVVAIDNVHRPGSTTERRADEVSDLAQVDMTRLHFTGRLQCISSQRDGRWEETDELEALGWFSRRAPDGEHSSAAGSAINGEALRALLYGTENLRKRPGTED